NFSLIVLNTGLVSDGPGCSFIVAGKHVYFYTRFLKLLNGISRRFLYFIGDGYNSKSLLIFSKPYDGLGLIAPFICFQKKFIGDVYIMLSKELFVTNQVNVFTISSPGTFT